MKKKLITLLLTLSVITLIGCSDATTIKAGDEGFVPISDAQLINVSSYLGFLKIFVDSETGVEYIIAKDNSGTAITPRLNAEGKVMVETKYIKK